MMCADHTVSPRRHVASALCAALPRVSAALALAICLGPVTALAQSFDCAKAQAPLDRTICASERLRRLDSQLAAAYAAALKQDAGHADTLRATQRAWARNRAGCLERAPTSGNGAANPEPCLIRSYTERLAALQPAASPQYQSPASAAQSDASPVTANRSLPQIIQVVAPAESKPPQSKAAGASASSPEGQGNAADAFAAPRPATGLPDIPAGAATLERTRFPTTGETDILLHVTAPGRFAIRATSPTGTALQLVDMLTGPGEREGWPGKQDGRIDALLDVGTYKLRAFGAPAAIGDTTLSVTAFNAAGAALLSPGYRPVALTLRDVQFQSFWLVVGDSPAPLRIEAAGRSLAALTLWRDGRDLVPLPAEMDVVASPPAHPMTDIVLSGRVPPGTYLVTAYGGPKLPWADGASDEPFYLRAGRSSALLAGGVTSQVGVFSSEIFDVPRDATHALVLLPQPADAHLAAGAADADTQTADLAKNDKARAALLDVAGKPAQPRFVTLQAAPGQAFTLRPLAAAQSVGTQALSPVHFARPGRYWLAVQEPANGGDEVPAAAILVRFRLNPDGSRTGSAEVLAEPGVPTIAPGHAWRTRFNLRGPTTLLFHVTAAETVAVRTEGPALTAHVTTPEGAVMNAMGNGTAATAWALSPGWYALVLTPKPHAFGILDLTLGPPGLQPPAPETAGPEAPVLPLGEQTVDAEHWLAVLVNCEPDAEAGLLARPVPLELADGPVLETQPAGATGSLAVHVRARGTMVLRDVAGGPALTSQVVEAGATTTVTLPVADHARTLALALLAAPDSTMPAPAPAPALAALRDGQPAFLDLDRDQETSFALTVGQGGLYQVQTTGRLKTTGRIGTSFIPDLAEADANGVGENMLLQRYLRAGQYRLDVSTKDSAGHLGISATEAPLAEGAELLPDGSVRATLTPGHGIAFPLRITTAGRYHLDLLGDGRNFTARLEDSDGWPLLAAGDLSSIDQDFGPGRYRLIVQPPSVEARVVARLQPIVKPAALTGHGPHLLPFDAPQSLEWREPANRNDRRPPDVWTFDLAGAATVSLTIDGDGMEAALEAAEPAGSDKPPLGRLIAGTPLKLTLQAGQYRVAARSLGRNDRLAYTITLHADELQPDVPRQVKLPADLSFAIATQRVVALTSFGRVPVRAELRDDAGQVVTRAAGRADDWNIAVSRVLPPGRYHLTLASLAPPPGAQADNDSNTDQANNDTDQANNDNGADQANIEDNTDQANNDSSTANSGDNADQTNSDDNAGQANGNSDQDNGTASNDQTASSKPPAQTEITLFLPQDQPDVPMPADGAVALAVGGVQHATLPAAPAGSLLVAAAEAPVELILAMEQWDRDGGWRTVGQSQGLAPIVAVPVADPNAQRRLSVWTVDGGTMPIHVAARAVTATPAQIGAVPLAPVALSGISRPWYAALVADPSAAMLHIAAEGGVLAASVLGRPAEPPDNSTIVAQSDTVWLLASQPTAPSLTVVAPPADAALAVAVPASGRASLPLAGGTSSALCGYVAESGLGQPGLDAGRGMGVTSGSAFALCGGPTLRAWNAGGAGPLRLRLRRVNLVSQPDAAVDQAFTGVLPPRTALKLHLPGGMKRLDVSLPARAVLVAGSEHANGVTVWAGDTALSRSLTGDWTEALLLNTGDTPAPVALGIAAGGAASGLADGDVYRRFFGARGSFMLPVTARAGEHLVLAGEATATALLADGQVRQGRSIQLDAPAQVVVTHGAGPLALWLEGAGVSPWPKTPPRDLTLPARLTLDGSAMALRLSPGAPMLLRLSSTAPAILAIGDDPPVLFSKGVATARYLPAGETVLHLLSPQDGPLSGSLELSGTPVIGQAEGIGTEVSVAPGGAAVFGFRVTAAGPVGLGVRADPDRVTARLLDEHGVTLATGVSMLRRLAPGHYLLEASVPPDAPTTVVRPAVLGIVPHPNPPPPDVIRGLMLAAGFAPPDNAR